jgi:hypothetical protein
LRGLVRHRFAEVYEKLFRKPLFRCPNVVTHFTLGPEVPTALGRMCTTGHHRSNKYFCERFMTFGVFSEHRSAWYVICHCPVPR